MVIGGLVTTGCADDLAVGVAQRGRFGAMTAKWHTILAAIKIGWINPAQSIQQTLQHMERQRGLLIFAFVSGVVADLQQENGDVGREERQLAAKYLQPYALFRERIRFW